MFENQEIYGIHWMGDFFDCQCDDSQWEKQAVIKVVDDLKEFGFDVLGHVYHEFSPQGITCVILLGESHCSIHTWPEHRKISLDCYTCVWNETKEQMMNNLISCFKLRWKPSSTKEHWMPRL